MILPDELKMYRNIFIKRKLNYKFIYLKAGIKTLLYRTKTRTCFDGITPEKWVKYFYEKLKPFEKIMDNDFIIIDNSQNQLDDVVNIILNKINK